MRRFTLFLMAAILLVLLSFAGFKAGQFVFSPKTLLFKNQAIMNSAIDTSSSFIANLIQLKNSFCADGVILQSKDDEKFCIKKPNLSESRGIIIDLTHNKAVLYDNWKVIKILPVAYQAKEGKWFETPTGYFKIGVKKEHHISSFAPVQMDYSVQVYEDFFMHAIPYDMNGTRVTSAFSGGCLRFEDNDAKEIFDFAQTGDQVIILKTFDNLESKPEFHMPIDIANYWIRQRFNNPYRQFWNHQGDINQIKLDYYQHTGVDFAPNKDATNLSAYAIYDGTVAKIQPNILGEEHGLGNTVILKHIINGETLYSLYGHLDSISPLLKEGDEVRSGDVIGTIGNTGYGCQNYWKIGDDSCNPPTDKTLNDTHLHFEIKKSPVLGNPDGGLACQNKDNSVRLCYGYTPNDPTQYGYLNPMDILFNKKVSSENKSGANTNATTTPIK